MQKAEVDTPFVAWFGRVFDRLLREQVSPDVAAQVALALVTDERDLQASDRTVEPGNGGATLIPPGTREVGGTHP
jgi:hypothetical protein